jgi:16S rRNA (guanine(966)-N(2))-methyltransferase RsmD
MPRVVAGTAGGIRLDAPEGKGTRPTSDRVKEALFSILAPRLSDAAVLDLYSGTGQLGIEALSRGAASAVFVDQDHSCAVKMRANLARTAMSDKARILSSSVMLSLSVLAQEKRAFDLVLVDPPYAVAISAFHEVAVRLQQEELLHPECMVVLEHDAKDEAELDVINLQRIRSCKYGSTMLTFYSWKPREPQEQGVTE